MICQGHDVESKENITDNETVQITKSQSSRKATESSKDNILPQLSTGKGLYVDPDEVYVEIAFVKPRWCPQVHHHFELGKIKSIEQLNHVLQTAQSLPLRRPYRKTALTAVDIRKYFIVKLYYKDNMVKKNVSLKLFFDKTVKYIIFPFNNTKQVYKKLSSDELESYIVDENHTQNLNYLSEVIYTRLVEFQKDQVVSKYDCKHEYRSFLLLNIK